MLKQDHIFKSQDNEGVYHLIKQNGLSIDWEITTLFYTILQKVDAYFAKTNFHPADHHDRNKNVRTDPNLRAIYSDYLKFYELSKQARYTRRSMNTNEKNASLKYYSKIDSHISRYM